MKKFTNKKFWWRKSLKLKAQYTKILLSQKTKRIFRLHNSLVITYKRKHGPAKYLAMWQLKFSFPIFFSIFFSSCVASFYRVNKTKIILHLSSLMCGDWNFFTHSYFTKNNKPYFFIYMLVKSLLKEGHLNAINASSNTKIYVVPSIWGTSKGRGNHKEIYLKNRVQIVVKKNHSSWKHTR
jgi:hypothetical protein